ncbi:MAG TPA: histidine phosphatase family protein [Mycobacterium sp.]
MTRRALLVVLTTVTAALVFAASALAASDIMLTFVRHAESQANADGIINTQVPGPDITALGRQQANDVAALLAGNGYDGIYASDMVRTQQTAAPLAAILGKRVTVLPGLHEISAGIYEGSSEDSGLGRLGYALPPVAWTLGARFVPIPGSTDPDGNAFEARTNDAVQTIYDSGNTNAVAFSHGATIMFWTMMNVDNPDLGLLLSHQLDNTGVVVVKGHPDDGWALVSWDGVAVDPDPPFLTKTLVNVRDLVTTPQAAAYAVEQAIATGDLAAVAGAFVKGVVDVALAPLKFAAAVATDVVDLVRDALPAKQSQPVTATALRTAVAEKAATAAEPVGVVTRSLKVADSVEPAADKDGADEKAMTDTTDPVAATEVAEASEAGVVKQSGTTADAAPSDDAANAADAKAAKAEDAGRTNAAEKADTTKPDQVSVKREQRAHDGLKAGKHGTGKPGKPAHPHADNDTAGDAPAGDGTQKDAA